MELEVREECELSRSSSNETESLLPTLYFRLNPGKLSVSAVTSWGICEITRRDTFL